MLLVLLTGFVAAPLRAQTPSTESVLLLSPAYLENPRLRGEIARGLRGAGLLALQVADLGLDPVLAACGQPGCAAEAARAAGKAALLVSVASTPKAESVRLELYWHDPSVGEFRERSVAPRDKVGSGIAALAQRVLQRRVLGQRALLSVDTVPAGAQVIVDGAVVGLTPFEQAWDAGLHDVRVELPGFEAQRRRVQLRPGDVQRLQVALTRPLSAAAARTSPPSGSSAPSAVNFVLGGALALAALPLLISGINPALNEGQCIASTPSGCVRADMGAPEAVLIGAGVLALGGSAFLFLAQPLRVRLEAAPHAVGLRASGTF